MIDAANPPLSVPAVRLSGLGFSYPDEAPTIEDVSLEIAAGSFTLLVGETGSGKTTFLRLLKPEISPHGSKRGAVEVFGIDVESFDPLTSATTLGYVGQDPENQIVCDTVWRELAFGLENVGVPSEVMRRRVAEVAMFFGIESWMHEHTADLSGGQKQILTLASIMAMQPRLIVLDEPTAELDPIAEKNILHALFRINRELGITVIVATHAPESMEDYATDILAIDQGRVRQQVYVKANDHAQTYRCISARNRVHDEDPGGSKLAYSEAIRLDDAFFRYGRDRSWVLRGLDLSVVESTIHALVGGNGVGKSTLLSIIAGSVKPQRGRMTNHYASSQALLPQNPKALLVADSVREELQEWKAAGSYRESDIDSILELFDLSEQQSQHPYDISRGQQQKLALAKIVLSQPRLLLLDEPSQGLDRRAKQEMMDIIVALKEQGTTILLATHDLDMVKCIADKVTMLFDGQTTGTENTAEFFEAAFFFSSQRDGSRPEGERHQGDSSHPNADGEPPCSAGFGGNEKRHYVSMGEDRKPPDASSAWLSDFLRGGR